MENDQKLRILYKLLDHNAGRYLSAEMQPKKYPPWVGWAGFASVQRSLLSYLNIVQQHLQKLTAFFERESLCAPALISSAMRAIITCTDEKPDDC
ncbi:MAG: hypothetical protein WC615_02900 [Mucilaginibacter sp.]|jgi:hypothetical protein|uniref:hypothetical protein n=1 Tax=Mucilaginibacter sp. TaxID=1882438 RepID=UPI003567A86C